MAGFVSRNLAELEKDPSLISETPVVEAPVEVKKPSIGEAVGRGFAKGATLGFGSRVSPIVEKGIGLASKVTGIGSQDVAERTLAKPMSALAAENIQEERKTQQARPIAFGTGEIAGSISSTAPLGVAATTPLRAGGISAAIGGAQAAGSSDQSGRELAKDIAKGSAISGVIGLGLGKLTSKALKNKADDMARRALGFIKSNIKKVGGENKATAAAADLLERGLVKGGLSDMAENVMALRNTAGDTIGDVIERLDKAGVSGIDMTQVATQFRSQFRDLLDEPAFQNLVPQVNKIIASIEKRGASASLKEAQKLKKVLQSLGWKEGSEIPGKEFARKAYLMVRDAIDDSIERFAPQVGDSKLANQFFDAKKAYQSAKTAEVAIEDALQRAAGNRQISLTDFIVASSQLGAGRADKAAISLLGKKVLESKRTQAATARILQRAAEIAEKGPNITVPVAAAGERLSDVVSGGSRQGRQF